MLAPSQLSKQVLCALVLISSSWSAAGRDGDPDLLAQYRTTPTTHGLFEIRQAAQEFLSKESRKVNLTYTALDPDVRLLVPRCVVPLRVRWAKASVYQDQPGVDVICKRTFDKKRGSSWDVFVPLYEKGTIEKWRRKKEAEKLNKGS